MDSAVGGCVVHCDGGWYEFRGGFGWMGGMEGVFMYIHMYVPYMYWKVSCLLVM